MAYVFSLSDDQYARLKTASHLYHRTPDQLMIDLISGLPQPLPALTDDEYVQRWQMFFSSVGSIQHGQALTNEEIDEMIGEEVADLHADIPTA